MVRLFHHQRVKLIKSTEGQRNFSRPAKPEIEKFFDFCDVKRPPFLVKVNTRCRDKKAPDSNLAPVPKMKSVVLLIAISLVLVAAQDERHHHHHHDNDNHIHLPGNGRQKIIGSFKYAND